MPYDADILVIGSGAGGGALAYRCAASGKSVIVLERGLAHPEGMGTDRHSVHDETATLVEKRPYDDRAVWMESQARRLYMGSISGGSTSLYGGALLRPSPRDFHPGESYGERLDRSAWDWPIEYETLEPYYDEAESLFAVAADPQGSFAPLATPGARVSAHRLPLAPSNERLWKRSQKAGLTPFQLPLAIDGRTCLRCDSCAGFLCPNGSRRSSSQLIQEAVEQGYSIQLRTGSEVESLVRRSDGDIAGVRVRNRRDGSITTMTARRYVISAGAIGSPAILMKSGFQHPMLGRNYMMHYSPVVAGIFLRKTHAAETFIKQLGFADFYFGTPDCPEKMGIIQSLPAPGRQMLAKSGVKLPQAIVHRLRNHMLPLVGIVEDLPNPSNRVSLTSTGELSLQHRFTEYDKHRGASLSAQMVQMLRRAGAIHCVARSFPSVEHVAHQCGTLRWGADSKQHVVDVTGKLYGSDNLFICDGSLLTTSLGVGPALTIAAIALRIADTLITDL